MGANAPLPPRDADGFLLDRADWNEHVATVLAREEGLTLEQIKQRLRLQLALELLHPSARLKVSDVAQRLGFSDVRAFRRAFIEWTGATPDEWRRSNPAALRSG